MSIANPGMRTGQSAPDLAVNYDECLAGGLERLRIELRPVVVLLDTKHPSVIARYAANTLRIKSRAEQLSGLPCLVVHHTNLPAPELLCPNIRAIMVNHNVQPISPEMDEVLYTFIRQTAIPMIGFCGGHHHIYQAYGGVCTDMRLLRDSEIDPNPSYQPGYFKEWGFTRVRILKQDPLFEGLGDEIIVMEQHVSECSRLPEEFQLLASTHECRVQAIRHRGKVLCGTQFHPEAWDDKHMDGRRVLQNFMRIAGMPE